jgi:glyoxalase/bleomycin resistance protein/dioxygenase superfamily protein
MPGLYIGRRRGSGSYNRWVFESLDFIYMPSADVAADVRYFTDVLGAKLVFAIDGMGTRVAMVELTDRPPRILLAGHLHGDRPVLVYRVADLARTVDELEGRGWRRGHMLEIPHGPICSFTAPGGQRLAIYELTRPEVAEHFAGRRDF